MPAMSSVSTDKPTIPVAIVGPTSYTGLFLIRLLRHHPQAQVTYLASQREQLPNIAEEFPQLRGVCELQCRPIDPAAIANEAEVVFTCLPHVAAMTHVPSLVDAGLKVIDLSGDYRLKDAAVYERYYKHAHSDVGRLAEAVYGLPEFFADDIAGADLVSNPGCYPTAAALAIAPLVRAGLVKPTGIVINAATGVSGGGRRPSPAFHFPEANEAFGPYNVPGFHRHQPEMEQTITTVAGKAAQVLFVPHLLPVNQGILETIYLDPASPANSATDDPSADAAYDVYEQAYGDEPFVRIRNELPNISHVRDTNYCDLSVRVAGGKVIVFAAIDNMVKGASGQAIQNMNLMFGLPQTAGLL